VDKPVTLVGFFCAALCALPAGQVSITGADRGASLVERDGAVIGRYIDDTYPGDPRLLEMTTSWCMARRTGAPVLLWFYFLPASANQILKIEHDGCARWSTAHRLRRTG
jgi:hypothetical protein